IPNQGRRSNQVQSLCAACRRYFFETRRVGKEGREVRDSEQRQRPERGLTSLRSFFWIPTTGRVSSIDGSASQCERKTDCCRVGAIPRKHNCDKTVAGPSQ